MFEYTGPGAAGLEVSQRVTITNVGAETGATSSIFPADGEVRRFLAAQGREGDYRELLPDPGCRYDEEMELDLSALEPLMACPHLPDNVKPVVEVEQRKVQQVFIGSCTNAGYSDIAKAATVLRGRHVHPDVSCTCAVSSRQVYKQLLRDGYIEALLDAGVRLLELACGPCCAIGQSPATDGVAVRTTNRNFRGRSGNPTAQIYLASPETAAATAVTGTFTTASQLLGPEELTRLAAIRDPDRMPVDDSLLLPPLPPEEAKQVPLVKGPGIAFLPVPEPPPRTLSAPVSLVAGDDVTTDDITPASAQFSSMRSNIPQMSQYCYHRYDPDFARRAKEMGRSVIVAGENYGQGSSREHAAINPMFLGVRAVIAKSIARIHKGNLINHGVIPMLFQDTADYSRIRQGDLLELEDLPDQLLEPSVVIRNVTRGFTFRARLELTDGQRQVLRHGGQLAYLKKQLQQGKEEGR